MLTLVWLVVSYFGQFNFGLGRATAKFAAQQLAHDGGHLLPVLIRSSLTVHLVLGLIGTGCLIAAVPTLVASVFSVPESLRPEAAGVLYLSAPTIPMILLSDCLRGLLEAHYRFDLIAAVQTPSTALNYLAPLVVLSYTDDLEMVVVATLLLRFIVLVAYWCRLRSIGSTSVSSVGLALGSGSTDALARRLGDYLGLGRTDPDVARSVDDRGHGVAKCRRLVCDSVRSRFQALALFRKFFGRDVSCVRVACARSSEGAVALYDKSVTMLTAVVLPPAVLLILTGPALFQSGSARSSPNMRSRHTFTNCRFRRKRDCASSVYATAEYRTGTSSGPITTPGSSMLRGARVVVGS